MDSKKSLCYAHLTRQWRHFVALFAHIRHTTACPQGSILMVIMLSHNRHNCCSLTCLLSLSICEELLEAIWLSVVQESSEYVVHMLCSECCVLELSCTTFSSWCGHFIDGTVLCCRSCWGILFACPCWEKVSSEHADEPSFSLIYSCYNNHISIFVKCLRFSK